jgi:hypothetical protein
MSRLILPAFLVVVLSAIPALGAQQAVLYEHFTAIW